MRNDMHDLFEYETIETQCPHCEKSYEIRLANRYQAIHTQCDKCNKIFTVDRSGTHATNPWKE